MPDKDLQEEIKELSEKMRSAPGAQTITDGILKVWNILIDKNISYGNSALNPQRVFSKAAPDEQIKVRLDDKLNRMIQGKEYPGDNDLLDLAGYLILLIGYQENNRTENG